MDIHHEVDRWLEGEDDPELADELKDMVAAGDEDALEDAFYRRLSFGTAGLRGVLGPGTNRMNAHTVAQATQGLADYLNKRFDAPSVAVCRDSRHHSHEFARVASEVLAANGVHVFVYPRIEPTPTLSFAVRRLGCSAGINITASHNPADYNGYKVYGPDGCQITEDAATAIEAAIAKVDVMHGAKTVDFDQALLEGKVEHIADSVLDEFVDAVLEQSLPDPAAKGTPLKLVYTPLNGTGLECMRKMLPRIGVDDVAVVPSQEKPDGDFPTCPYPNPELKEALAEGIKLSKEVRPDLLLATDPDADRVGVAVADGGDYRLLTGNEIGTLLLDYVCRMREGAGSMPADPVAVSTIVSTSMIDAVAADHGVHVVRTLTGFKYIGDVITRLAEKGQEARFVLGFEESYGYLSGAHVRDKDAINASMLICQMAQSYKAHGKSLADAMRDLYEEYGYYQNKTLSYKFPGEDGSERMAAIMDGLRTSAPATVAGRPVQRVVDYQKGVGDLPRANVVEFDLGEGNKLLVRPSGTEPKIKAYLFAKAPSMAESDQVLDALKKTADELMA